MQCFCFDISFYCEHKRRDLSGFRRSSDDGFFERHFYEWFPWINIMIHFDGVWWNVRSLRQIFARRISARRFRSSAQIIETYCLEPGKTSKKGLCIIYRIWTVHGVIEFSDRRCDAIETARLNLIDEISTDCASSKRKRDFAWFPNRACYISRSPFFHFPTSLTMRRIFSYLYISRV